MKILKPLAYFIALTTSPFLIAKNKSDTNEILHDDARTQLLWQVEKKWKEPDHKKITAGKNKIAPQEDESSASDQMMLKLDALIIPSVELNDATIMEAIDYLKQKSCELDPEKKGINIFLKRAPSFEKSEQSKNVAENKISGSPTQEPLIFLQLHEVPFFVALTYFAKQANLKIKVDPHAVELLPILDDAEALVIKQYQVPSNFLPSKESPSDASLEIATYSKQDTSRLPAHYEAQEYLQFQGIPFPSGASANYLPSSSRLIIRNTQNNIDLIDALVNASMRSRPSQVSIETKFIEINQDDLDQLGFNWLLGAFQLGNSGVYGSGGGARTALNASAYPFATTGINPVGSLGLGDGNITENSIDGIMATGLHLANKAATAAPGIFSIAGIQSDPQFQVLLRALQQKKGVDLMAAPHVTTKSGVKAVVKIIDEFIYPTRYTPPQIPSSTTNSSTKSVYQPPSTITPAFPDAWRTKNLGVILEAKPTIQPDGTTIDLELHPQITDFDGFINYGTPINTVGYNFSATNVSAIPFSETLTTNTINQPVFSLREVKTSVTVANGQTVILGGLIREDIQKFHNKVPLLGDLPLAGRLFQSNGERKVKKNLIIFVTPKILDASGQN